MIDIKMHAYLEKDCIVAFNAAMAMVSLSPEMVNIEINYLPWKFTQYIGSMSKPHEAVSMFNNIKAMNE